MKNTETEVASTNVSREAGETPSAVAAANVGAAESVPRSEFLDRVSEIPVVNAAKGYGVAAYQQVKQLSSFTNYAFSKAEMTALYLAVTAKPFLEKVQPQAQLIDNLACRGLTAVEEKAPFLHKTPEQLVEDARKLCCATVDKGFQTVEGLKAAGSETLSNVKNYGLQKSNDLLTGTEELVDKYLPPAFEEGTTEGKAADSQSVPERAGKLTSKIGLRVYGHGAAKLLTLNNLSLDSVSKLFYTVELLQQVKQNYANKSVQEYVDEAKVKATWIWEELRKSPDQAEGLERRMLYVARSMTSVLVHVYDLTAVSLSGLPQNYSDGFNAASRYASELFTQFDQATNAGEITAGVLQVVQVKLAALRNIVQGLSTQAEQIEMEELGSNREPNNAVET